MVKKLILGILGLITAVFIYRILDHLGRRWGATEVEVTMKIPGDELIPEPDEQTTHAITIRAGTADVWPWLVQMGYGRAGWYMDGLVSSLVDNYYWPNTVPESVRAELKHSADEIVPELQTLSLGDHIADGPIDMVYFNVSRLEPERVLALYSNTHLTYLTPHFLSRTAMASYGEFCWNFYLIPVTSNSCRLVLRTRAAYGPRFIRILSKPLILLADFFYARQMLNGIKRRAEGAGSSPAPM